MNQLFQVRTKMLMTILRLGWAEGGLDVTKVSIVDVNRYKLDVNKARIDVNKNRHIKSLNS